ncbi:glycoside hydrolase family 28 protein [Flavobacterium sp.]|uniref:glycoside hydrolase family 28 protein n=1 Tax=Flavobacterium sp. TaxID=239 RepID=UPI003C417000
MINFKNGIKTLVIVVFLIIVCAFTEKEKTFIVTDYGAKGDSLTVNTIFIQKAIDDCSTNGGGTVIIPKGIFISGTILLKDNVILNISKEAKLVGSSNPLDYQSIDTFTDAVKKIRGNCLIGALNAKNIGITGHGIIDGNGEAFTMPLLKLKFESLGLDKNTKDFGVNRPFLLRFVKSTKIKIKDITIRQAAAWACHFYQSSNIDVDGMTVYNHANSNNDGIDLDSSHDVEIKNCNIDTGDDSICIKATSSQPTYNVKVRNCKIKSEWGALKFGTESMGDFYNIDIRDCEIYDTRGGGIKILSVDGANIHDINIQNIKMDDVEMPIFIRLGERLNTYREADKRKVGTINNVVVKNIKATTRSLENSRVNPPSGILITGTPNHKIGKVTLENINITLPGGGKKSDVGIIEEQETKYPEFSFFKVLPAYGMYARHIDGLSTKNINFKITAADEREDVILEK